MPFDVPPHLWGRDAGVFREREIATSAVRVTALFVAIIPRYARRSGDSNDANAHANDSNHSNGIRILASLSTERSEVLYYYSLFKGLTVPGPRPVPLSTGTGEEWQRKSRS